jgi:hypothetical protein
MDRFLLSLVSLGTFLLARDVGAQTGQQVNPLRENAMQQLIGMICSDNGEWLRCYSLPPPNCRSITEGYVRPCVDRILSTVTHELKGQEELQTMQRLLGCFNEEFMRRYGAGQVKSKECQLPPKHLR